MQQRDIITSMGGFDVIRQRVKEVLEAEFPGVKVQPKSVVVENSDIGKCSIKIVFDFEERVKDIEEVEQRLGVNLHNAVGPYSFAYSDRKKGGYVLRDGRDRKFYRVREKFIVEHFSKGVPK